jgi:hyperosmotically inducible protein
MKSEPAQLQGKALIKRACEPGLDASRVEQTLTSDADIARAVADLFRHETLTPDRVQAVVENGWVTLEGEVMWQHRRAAVEDAVRCLHGVTGVTNRISIKPLIQAGVIKANIECAFAHRGRLEAQAIRVEAVNAEVRLKGNVPSVEHKLLAEATARDTPGVTKIVNELVVRGA